MTMFWYGFAVGFVVCAALAVAAVMWLGRHFNG